MKQNILILISLLTLIFVVIEERDINSLHRQVSIDTVEVITSGIVNESLTCKIGSVTSFKDLGNGAVVIPCSELRKYATTTDY